MLVAARASTTTGFRPLTYPILGVDGASCSCSSLGVRPHRRRRDALDAPSAR